MSLFKKLKNIFTSQNQKDNSNESNLSQIELQQKFVSENKLRFKNKVAGLDDLEISFNKLQDLPSSDEIFEIESKVFQLWSLIDEEKTSPELLNVIYVLNLFSQTQNGGFISFVDNGSGEYFHETQGALKSVGLKEIELVLEKIALNFPDKSVPKDMCERREIIDEIHETKSISIEELDQWDESFYKNEYQYKMKVINYIRANTKNHSQQ